MDSMCDARGVALVALGLMMCLTMAANASDMPHYTGPVESDGFHAHDGGLRWAVGVNSFQVVRSVPTNPSATDGSGADFRHHVSMAHWGGRFWVYHIAGVHTHEEKTGRLNWSDKGVTWPNANAAEVFPYATHQRAAFYVASNNTFLVTTWYSQHGESGRGGVGSRLVREIRGPGDFGPVHVIKHNAAGAADTGYAVYSSSSDAAYKAACDELLADKLHRQQWQEEDQDHPFYVVSDVGGNVWWKAFAWYTRDNGDIVGFFKGPKMTVAPAWDFGQVPAPQGEYSSVDAQGVRTFDQFGLHGSSKIWGARTPDGRFAVTGNFPNTMGGRWPLAVTTSDDGFTFDTPYATVAGDMSPMRYPNPVFDNKDAGHQYVRGICEGNGAPPGNATWVTYSYNKEDIWVSMIPTPIEATVTGDVSDDFSSATPGGPVSGWNIRSAQWAEVSVVEEGGNRFLRLADRDACDYAKAFRVFEASGAASLSFKLRPHQTDHGTLEIDVMDERGRRPVRIAFDDAGAVAANTGEAMSNVGSYVAGSWVDVSVEIDAAARTYDLLVDGAALVTGAPLAAYVTSVERLEFRTGAHRLRDFERRPYWGGTPYVTDTLPNADAQTPEAIYDVDDVVLAKTADPLNGLIASIDQVSSGRTYDLGIASVGAKPYVDREYQIEALPAGLAGCEMVRTANDDDMVATTDHLRFTLSRAAKVYIAFKSDATTLPGWASEFTPEAGSISAGIAGTFNIYARTFDAGQVTLGGNDRGATGASSCYFVIAAEDAAAPPEQRPFADAARAVPGRLEAEDYDTGGEGIAYHDSTPGNEGGVCRADDVDLAGDSTVVVGWSEPGEWLEYTIEADAGLYDVTVRVASPNDDTTLQLSLGDAPDGSDFSCLAMLAVPNTGAGDVYQDVEVNGVALGGGPGVLRLDLLTGGYNIDWIEFSPASADPDEDGDGLADAWELSWFGDLSHDGTADGDADGLTDADEFALGTDPLDQDSDDDGMIDGDEADAGFDPLDDDEDGNGGPDGLDDWDGDGATNAFELADGSDAGAVPREQHVAEPSPLSCAARGGDAPRAMLAHVLLALGAPALLVMRTRRALRRRTAA